MSTSVQEKEHSKGGTKRSGLPANATRLKAVQILIVATAFWGLSFPATKALTITQQELLPGSNSWFLSSLCVIYRFGLAAVIMLFFSLRTLGQMTRAELTQGVGLGLFAGGGILLQVDGMAYTSASTSAFLTQCYCVIIPLWVAWRQRRWPPPRVLLSCLLVSAGVAVLADVDWRHFQIGRGEWETVFASILFAGQILLLECPRYAQNDANHFSLVMFVVISLVCLPVALLTAQQPADWVRAYSSGPAMGMLGILALFCTIGAYMLMNQWQRYVTATEAGLIYCIEPLFASLLALFVPAWLSAWASVHYANERLTMSLLMGGGLITAANMIIQLPARWGNKNSRGK